MGGGLLNQIFILCSERWNNRCFSLQKVAGWHFLFWDDPLQIRGNGFNGSHTDIFSFCCFVSRCASCLCLQTAFCAESKIKALVFAFMSLFVSACDHRTAGRCLGLIGPFFRPNVATGGSHISIVCSFFFPTQPQRVLHLESDFSACSVHIFLQVS